jgi:hypothetical protein
MRDNQLLLSLFTICLIVLLHTACSKIVPAETMPMVIGIDKVSTITKYNTQGTDSEKITAVQLYNGTTDLGVYSLPATVNWLGSANNMIQVYGAINENGISATKTFYPFFQPDTFNIPFNPAKPIKIAPKMRYLNSTYFCLLEDFEGGNTFERYTGDTTVVRVVNKSQAYQGSAYGALYLGGKVKTVDVQNQNAFINVPLQGQAFFAELNYKCNVPFMVGIEAIQGSNTPTFSYPVIVNPKTSWNKIYVNLTTEVQRAQADYYYLHITAKLPDTQKSGFIYLDNVKVLHL